MTRNDSNFSSTNFSSRGHSTLEPSIHKNIENVLFQLAVFTHLLTFAFDIEYWPVMIYIRNQFIGDIFTRKFTFGYHATSHCLHFRHVFSLLLHSNLGFFVFPSVIWTLGHYHYISSCGHLSLIHI